MLVVVVIRIPGDQFPAPTAIIWLDMAELVNGGFTTLMFPLIISAIGIVVCMLSSFLATDIKPVGSAKDVETVLKTQLLVTALLMTVVMYPVTQTVLPDHFQVTRVAAHPDGDLISVLAEASNWTLGDRPSVDVVVDGTPLRAFFCVCCWVRRSYKL